MSLEQTINTRYEFATQFGCVCVVVKENDTARSLIDDAIENKATFFDGEENLMCVRFPGRPQEVYTERAIGRTFEQENRRGKG